MLNIGQIWAYPTDTSFALGVRADDSRMLFELKSLKKRKDYQYFSLMTKDIHMLNKFAHIPQNINHKWFFEKPRTAILKPKDLACNPEDLNKYWPDHAVAFRICTIPEVAQFIDYPVTATSANMFGEEPIYKTSILKEIFGTKECFGGGVHIYDIIENLPHIPASEIWDFVSSPENPTQIR